MRKVFIGAAASLLCGTSLGHAGGIDKSGQSVSALFQEGRYVEFSMGRVRPSISGTDVLSNPTGDVAGDYTQLGFAYKADVNEKLSYAVILDQPFGADIAYGGNPAASMLGGTLAKADATAASVLLRYKLTDRFAVHGGLRAQQSDAGITLSGLAYGPFNGYSVALDQDLALGYSVGASYEIPDIALRVAVTYNSEINHEFATVEQTGIPVPSVTSVTTPQSVNLDAQTGIAKDTLLFGQVRWVEWSKFKLSPIAFATATGGASLVNLDDTVTYTLGVGRKINDTWSGAASVSYEKSSDPVVSPLAPSDGRLGVTLAAVYTHGNMKITTGLNYTQLGDANPSTGTPPVTRAVMTGSSAMGLGVKVGFSF